MHVIVNRIVIELKKYIYKPKIQLILKDEELIVNFQKNTNGITKLKYLIIRSSRT